MRFTKRTKLNIRVKHQKISSQYDESVQKMAAIGEEVENDFLDKEHNVEVDDLPECVKGSLQISMKRCQKFK